MQNPIEEYESLLEKIFGVYLDATEGFRHISKTAHVFISPGTSKDRTRNTRGESPAGYVVYRLGTHETGDYMELSARTGEEIITNNKEDGANWDFMGSMCIVSAYQWWEDHYRSAIAEYLCIHKDDLKIPIFGDLRRLRRCIIHRPHRDTWDDILKNLECFDWDTSRTEEVIFTKNIVSSVWHKARIALRELNK